MRSKKPARLDPADHVREASTPLRNAGLPDQNRPAAMPAIADGAIGYSSPACYAHEIAPEYFGDSLAMSGQELIELLDALLQGERAGADTIAAFLNDFDSDTPPGRHLSAVRSDEENHCAILAELMRQLGGTPSAPSAEFLTKALAVRGKVARLELINRQQQWVAHTIGQALSHIEQDFVRQALVAMRESHLLKIEACDALIEMLQA